MAEKTAKITNTADAANTANAADAGTQMFHLKVRHRGRIPQTGIYFGKFLRMFLYEGDWKVLPMAALIAGLVSIVVSKNFFITAEGTKIGALSFACICIWNGCFNSIQVVCRERDVLKREHRSGMHISSYVVAHMLYQCILCILQTVVTLYTTRMLGVRYPSAGVFTSWMIVDFGITMFLITYAADMMSLFISSLCHTTTSAMTVMPFVLIFQLVFSGSLFPLPDLAKPISAFTISNPGMSAMSAQADVNNLPYSSVDTTIRNLKGNEIKATLTLGQVLDVLEDEDKDAVRRLRSVELDGESTLGELIDAFAQEPDVQDKRDTGFTVNTSVGEVLQIIGEDKVREFLSESTARSSYNPDFDCTADNIILYWLHILFFVVAFALASVIALEFIDKDKR